MINSVCGIKSTGRICTDLATALEAEGHDVKIGYGRETVPNQFQKYAVRIGNESGIKLHGVKARLMDADGLGSVVATKRFLRWVKEYNPDVIHLHNLHGYYINVPLLFQYINENRKKVIWTLHDMWAFTGHSATCDLYNCEKWETGCRNCLAFRAYPASFVDRSEKNYHWKKELFTSVRYMTVVTPSSWLAGMVKRSYLKNHDVVVIHNGIDIKQFKPVETAFRNIYHLENKTLIMGCASRWVERKGLEDFIRLSDMLDNRYKIMLIGLDIEQIRILPTTILGIGRTDSVKELAQYYSAADIFLNLTYADNYPTVNLEALACGRPVITYNTGGSAECLNGKNGKAFRKGDLEGIAHFLNEEYTPSTFEVKENFELDKSVTTSAYLAQIKKLF